MVVTVDTESGSDLPSQVTTQTARRSTIKSARRFKFKCPKQLQCQDVPQSLRPNALTLSRRLLKLNALMFLARTANKCQKRWQFVKVHNGCIRVKASEATLQIVFFYIRRLMAKRIYENILDDHKSILWKASLQL